MRRSIFLLLLLTAVISCRSTSIVDEKWLCDNYYKTEAMVQMRDGVKLYTSVYHPIGVSDRPILIVRTPYSCAPYGNGFKTDLTEYMSEFLKNRYIIVFQDVRGRYMSEGQFLNVRPFIPDKSDSQTDEASDTYDTIEWLLENTDNNGSVGVTGMSYPGFYATLAALSCHPALKAVSPQAPILDWYKGDDVHHNGALMLLDIYSFATYMFKEHNNPVQEDHGLPSPIGENAYLWFSDRFTPSSLTTSLPDTLTFWNEILDHPHYDNYWVERSLEQHLNNIEPAILVVGGEYDTDDCYGALNTYKLIKSNSPETDLHFVYGPWSHGAWHNPDYVGLGAIKFGENLSNYFMSKIEYPFFRYYLENKGKRPDPVYIYASGSDCWQVLDKWPSDNITYRSLYLTPDDSLAFNPSTVRESSSTYRSDPLNPVPFMENASRRDNSYMVADQKFASLRPDVLTFVSSAVNETIRIQGPIRAKLDLSITSDDADIIVKFIDVHPDGYQMLVRGDVFPLRYRNGYDQPVRSVPGERMHLDFTMNDVAHWVLPGHKMMIQIQSTWFPLVNINPQTYMDNIYDADEDHYVESEITVYHQNDASSHIILPILM